MTVQRRLVAIVVTGAVLAVALAAALLAGQTATDRAIQRVSTAANRLEAMREVDGTVARYGRQVVNQLLFGLDRGGDLQSARNAMERALATLTRVTRAELNTLDDPTELQRELQEVETVRRMIDLYHVIDAAATRAFTLVRQGDVPGATAMVSRQVDFPLTNEMQTLIDRSLSAESLDVAGRIEELRDAQGTQLAVGSALAVLLLLALATQALDLHRVIRRSIGGLEATTGAFAAGRFETQTQSPPAAEFTGLATDLATVGDSVRQQQAASREEREALATEMAGLTSRQAEASERLRRIDSDRGQFLADVGHQLRTPLTVLRGEADVALRGRAAVPELRESMERVRAQAAELGLLLDDLIEGARQDADAQPIVLAKTHLDDIISVAMDEARVLAEPREISLVLDLDDGRAEIDADFRRLKQALLIGLDNAVKHSPPGSSISLQTTIENRRLAVRISDEGPGIAEEDRPRLFERFYRGRMERDLLNSGFGIGLSIARGIVERHGGTLSLDNRSEGGALFEIMLPMASEA